MRLRGRCFALFFGLRLPLVQVKATVPRFFIVYNLTAGRVKQTNFKMKRIMFTALAVGLGLSASLLAQVPSYVPTNGLVGWYPFSGNANDESGNGNNGTVNGATLTADRFGVANKAYSFDGNDWIEMIFQQTLEFSASIWFNASSQNPNYMGIAQHKENCERGAGYILELYNNSLRCVATNCGQCGNICPNYFDFFNISSTGINQWYHLVLTCNVNGVYNLYLNGVLIHTTTNTTTLCQFNVPFSVGKHHDGVDLYYFFGFIDDVGAWDRALTECEIQDLYNSQINSVAGSISVAPNPASIGSNVTLLTAPYSTNVQWQSNPSNYGWQNVPSNTNYSGGTTNTLTISNVQLSNHNQPFRVIASVGNCSDTSNVANIQITDTCITNVTVYDTLLTSVTDTLIINTTLSLPAPNNENTILIYPNPASDHITIDNGNFAAMAGYSIKIENNAGQQVFQSAINQQQFYVDLSTWTGNGLYFVHLIDPQNNTVTVRKIVLQ